MEYRKNVEEMKSSEEYKKVSEEYHKPTKEFFSAAEEYHSPAKEYFINDGIEQAADKTKKKKSAGLMKKVRQMGYLVAASVAVVTVAQTVEPTITQNNQMQDEMPTDDVTHSGDIAINVPGLGGDSTIKDPVDNVAESEAIEENSEELLEGYLDVSSVENFSSANCGIMLVKEDGLWGAWSLSGEVLCEPKYNGENWCAPNDEGFSVVSNDGIYYILDSRGKEIFSWDEPAEKVRITEHNIIYIRQYGEQASDGIGRAYYFNVDGTLLYEAVDRIGDIFEPMPFNDGVAMINMAIENDQWESPYMLYENGSLRKVLDSDGNEPYYWIWGGAYTDGYYLGHSGEGLSLVDVDTGKGITPIWLSEIVNQYVPDFSYEDTYLKGYYENGQYLFNYHTYACLEAVNGEETVNILFDFRDGNWESYSVNRVIAIYDEIIMDDFKYLLAIEDDAYFYVDWNGNVISKTYVDATAFNEDGYAMIIEESGTAYLINEQFEKLDTIENVTSVGNAGDAFGMTYEEKTVIYVPDAFVR